MLMKFLPRSLDFRRRWLSELLAKRFLNSGYYKIKAINEISAYRNRKETFNRETAGKTPRAIVLETTNACNLNCPMCSTQDGRRKKGEMALDLFEDMVKEVKRLGLNKDYLFMHTVGEPLLYSKLPQAFEICKRHGIKLYLVSNGLLLDKHRDLLKEYPEVIDTFTFSIDGASKQVYEKLRLGGKFEKLMENLEIITDLNRNLTHDKKIKLSFQAIIREENFNEIPSLFKVYSKYFQPDLMFFSFMSSLSAFHTEAGYYKLSKLYNDGLRTINSPCRLLWTETHVLHNGDVSACCRDYHGEMIVGNIHEQSIVDIWNGELYQEYRHSHLTRNFEKLTLCKDCFVMKREAEIMLNCYIHYLFARYENESHEFYLLKISQMLEFFGNDFQDNKSKSVQGLSFFDG